METTMDQYELQHLNKWIEAHTYSYSDRDAIRQAMSGAWLADAEYFEANGYSWTQIFKLADCEKYMDPPSVTPKFTDWYETAMQTWNPNQ